MIDIFHHRLQYVERGIERIIAAPTFPIYDVDDLPQDAIKGQIVLGTDGSINWFDGTWHTRIDNTSIGSPPQDVVNGQIVIGLDNSLHWFVNDTWYGVAGVSCIGNPPQDAINGQLAIGNSCIVWFSNDDWYGFGTIAPTAVDAVFEALLRTFFSPSDQLICDICADNGGEPGTVLYTSSPTTIIDAILNPFNFTSIELTVGTTYWFVLRRTGIVTNSSFYGWVQGGGAGPLFGYYDGSIWHVSSGGLDARWTVDGINIFSNSAGSVTGPFGNVGVDKIAVNFVYSV